VSSMGIADIAKPCGQFVHSQSRNGQLSLSSRALPLSPEDWKLMYQVQSSLQELKALIDAHSK
jgi:hypothetical protein